MVFTDDVAFVAENKEDVKELTKILLKEEAKKGLHVNVSETDFMKIS